MVNARLTQATGTTERDAGLVMAGEIGGPATLGGDKNYDTKDFVCRCRDRDITPHVAQNTANRSSAIDGRTTRHPGYSVSQKKRKRIEEVFGWLKTIGLMRQTRHRGVDRVGWMFQFATAAYNLVRMRNLCPATV